MKCKRRCISFSARESPRSLPFVVPLHPPLGFEEQAHEGVPTFTKNPRPGDEPRLLPCLGPFHCELCTVGGPATGAADTCCHAESGG